MGLKTDLRLIDYDPDFKVFHELMQKKIRKVLLVLSPYDAFILEEGGSLTSKIVSEYRGLNLSHPPRMIRVTTGKEALKQLADIQFDLVITLPSVDDMDCLTLGREIKKIDPGLPVILLSRNLKGICSDISTLNNNGIDKLFIWSMDPDFLMSLVKNVEDHLNVAHDTKVAMVKVIILVEDSPHYRSSFLPDLYNEVVSQTQAILDESLNQEHRLVKMRARPKILVAENYEEAFELFQRFKPYIIAVISDARFPKNGRLTDNAGILLLKRIRREVPDMPLLLLSSEPSNKEDAKAVPAVFADKNSPGLEDGIHDFFLNYLGFGDFVFRLPDGKEIDRAGNLHVLEEKIKTIPDESLTYHARGNHFSNWVMSRSEIALASMLNKKTLENLTDTSELRQDIVGKIHAIRKLRQSGIVAPFSTDSFDPDIMDFVLIGNGSMGGKSLGLAFMASCFRKNPDLFQSFPDVQIRIPQTCVITTDGFDSFISHNKFHHANWETDDHDIARRFLAADMPPWLEKQLAAYLKKIDKPLSIRSSSLLEDAQYKPYAGLFETFMIPNNHADFKVRLAHLLAAVKLVFSSTFFAGPRAYSKATKTTKQDRDCMAVIIQHLVGKVYGDYYYPAISGVAQSHNYYPYGKMKPEEGTALIALGFGKTVVDGERCLRFSPQYPKIMPQLSTVEDTLTYTQRYFYALHMHAYPETLSFTTNSNLTRRELADAETEFPVQRLCSTYIANEQRIRDSFQAGAKVLTFASVLKYSSFPLPGILKELLEIGRKGMGCPVEIEFTVDLHEHHSPGEFYFLQIRPMVAGGEQPRINITQDDIKQAFCYSTQGLGHGCFNNLQDIIYVKPHDFDPAKTMQVAEDIKKINAELTQEDKPYLLIGPGRWGSADRLLGIPVRWQDISSVGAIIELQNEQLKVDPSQGSHFFHNITSMGIPYLTVIEGRDNFDWKKLAGLPVRKETRFLRHIRLKKALILKVDSAQTGESMVSTEQ